MPLDDLPDGFVSPTRTAIKDGFTRDYQLRQKGSPTGEGSQANIDGAVIADTLLPVYANNVSIARGANLRDMTREALKAEARAIGIPQELPEGAGNGFVDITASATGVFLSTSQIAKDEARNLTFRVATAGTYFQGQPVPLVGVNTGPQTNIPAGTNLKWQGGPPSLGGIATVRADSNGDGFTGGRAAETNDDIIRRIESARAEPPAGGNIAEIRQMVFDAGLDLGIPIQEVFVFSAVRGPGTYSYAFTLRPGDAGSSRIPTSIQIAQVRAYLHRSLPEDDGILAASIIESYVSIQLAVEWVSDGWVNAAPWPRAADDMFVYVASGTPAPTGTTMTVRTLSATPVPPKAGDVIAFYKRSTSTFVRKRIASVVATDLSPLGWSYAIVIDATNNASDTLYVPTANERFCPWSPSLNIIPKPVLEEFDLLGVSEQVDPNEWWDEGERLKRHPRDPEVAPSAIRHKTFNKTEDLPQLRDLEVLSPDLPFACPVGVPGASVNILVAKSILVFPIT